MSLDYEVNVESISLSLFSLTNLIPAVSLFTERNEGAGIRLVRTRKGIPHVHSLLVLTVGPY